MAVAFYDNQEPIAAAGTVEIDRVYCLGWQRFGDLEWSRWIASTAGCPAGSGIATCLTGSVPMSRMSRTSSRRSSPRGCRSAASYPHPTGLHGRRSSRPPSRPYHRLR